MQLIVPDSVDLGGHQLPRYAPEQFNDAVLGFTGDVQERDQMHERKTLKIRVLGEVRNAFLVSSESGLSR